MSAPFSMLKRQILRSLLAALLFSLSLLVSTRASAAPPRVPAGARSMGIVTDPPITAVAGAAPSKGAALGTIFVAWCADRFGSPAVHVGEWSLNEAVWLSDQQARRVEVCPETLRLASSRQRIVLVVGHGGGTSELVAFARSAGELAQVSAITYDNAEAPSLDADDRFVVLATYERRTPLVAANASSPVEPPFHALHVRVLDASTLQVVNARVFSGAHLLRRHANPDAAGHAVRLLEGRLFVAVADDEPRVVGTRALPSLVTEMERTFPVPVHERTPSSSSIVLNRLGDSLVVGVGATFVLSSKLATVARHALPITAPLAYDTTSRRALATDGEPVKLDGWRVRVVDAANRKEAPFSRDGEALGVLFAHGHGVVLGARDAPDPSRSGPATWAIRLLP